jgi:hypothetical protein
MQMLPRTGGEEKLKYVLRGYLPENIHNADKTTCFIICYKTEEKIGGKKNSERLTALFCCNVSPLMRTKQYI